MTGAVKLLTAGSGGINLQPASSIASDVTVNVPSQNCTLGIQGPAFSATLTTGVTGIGSGYYAFNAVAFTEQYDYGSGFNASTGVFTAPITGIYLFNIAIAYTANGASTDCNFELVVNGSAIPVNAYNPALVGAVGGVDGAFWIQQPLMVSVGSGQTVYMRLYTNDTSWSLNTSTRFQGVLLRAA